MGLKKPSRRYFAFTLLEGEIDEKKILDALRETLGIVNFSRAEIKLEKYGKIFVVICRREWLYQCRGAIALNYPILPLGVSGTRYGLQRLLERQGIKIAVRKGRR